MRKTLALLCSVVAACGSSTDANRDGIADGIRSPDSVSVVAPSTPVGTLSGQVLTTDFKPLSGVRVDLILGGAQTAEMMDFSATTNNEGAWSISGVPAAANAQVVFSKMGFSTARAAAFVPGNAGNFPVNNGNANVGTVLLTELKGTFRMQLVTAGGQPAKSVRCLLEVSPSAVRFQDNFGTYGNPVGVFVTEATTNDLGELAIMNVPDIAEEARIDGRYVLTVEAHDADGDKRIDYLGTRRDLSARDIFTGVAPTVITLPAARVAGNLRVLASNVDSMVNGPGDPLKNMVKMGESLWFVFDQAVVSASVGVKLTDETGLTTIATNKNINPATPNVLQVVINGAIEDGREYNIALRATSAENGSTFQQAAYFFGGDKMMPKTFAIEKITWRRPAANMSTMMRLEPGDRVVVTFNQPIRLAGGQNVEVLIEADLDGMGGRGNIIGEKSLPNATMQNTSGFPIVPMEPIAEPNSTFANLASGYTTRYEFTYPPGFLTVPIGTNFHVFFSEIPSSLLGYRTLWGGGIELDATAALSAP